MSIPFERGKKDGQWTDEQIRTAGFDSIEACLNHQEKVLQEEMEKLPHLYQSNPVYAQRQAEYLEGLRAAIRQSLGNRIKKEERS